MSDHYFLSFQLVRVSRLTVGTMSIELSSFILVGHIELGKVTLRGRTGSKGRDSVNETQVQA